MKMVMPEIFKIVNGTPVATTNGGINCDFINLKDALNVTIIVELLQAATHTTALTVDEATTVAGGSATQLLTVQKVWKNADVSATDTLVRSADAITILATAGTTDQQLVMQVDPASLTAGFDCIRAALDNSGEGTNFATVTYLIETRYPQATPPTAITD